MGQSNKVRSSVASDWKDGKRPLEEDECVSEVLHPLPNAKIHAELSHCGEWLLAARYSRTGNMDHTTGRRHLVHTAEWSNGDSYM